MKIAPADFGKILLPAAALFFFFSCGIKKPPAPPEKIFPPAVKDFKVMARDRCAELSWKYPGLELPDKYRIERTEQAGGDAAGQGMEKVFETSGKEVGLQDCTLQAGFEYGYAVIGVSQSGFAGEPGKTAWINVPLIPSAPENFQARPGDKFVDLSWSAAPGLAYNIYRSTQADQFLGRPINPGPVSEDKYPDAGLDNGKEYFYCLRSDLLQKNYPQLESACAALSATPVDLIPPARTRGLAVTLTDQGVLLRWFNSPEPGYREQPGGWIETMSYSES